MSGTTVAKVIKFYIPDIFRKRTHWIPRKQRGKLIELCRTEKKTA